MTLIAIGLMSGTSLDGLDICLAEFTQINGCWTYRILDAETSAYTHDWEQKLKSAVHLSSEKLLSLNTEYGRYLGEQVQKFIERNGVEQVDLIASHGHTVFHQPHNGFTLQIGDGRAIKIITQKAVIYDFRSQDVLLGGSGAPLVPIGDELLFSEYDACLNIGGFSNVSLQQNGQRIAFDICPVNVILNKYAQHLDKKYDENGEIARSGTINDEMLRRLEALPFYNQAAPKSLGTEWVEENVSPLLKNEKPENILATFSEHAASQIASVFNNLELRTVLCTGGGTYNQFLLERIRSKSDVQLIVPDEQLINFKEALVFALMGVLKINNETNVLASATGSLFNHSSGLVV